MLLPGNAHPRPHALPPEPQEGLRKNIKFEKLTVTLLLTKQVS